MATRLLLCALATVKRPPAALYARGQAQARDLMPLGRALVVGGLLLTLAGCVTYPYAV
jgi:hypothetical protein